MWGRNAGPRVRASFIGNYLLCSPGTQISCFSPSAFSWRQAAFVDSYCWAAVQQRSSLQSESGNLPLWLHKVMRRCPACLALAV